MVEGGGRGNDRPSNQPSISTGKLVAKIQAQIIFWAGTSNVSTPRACVRARLLELGAACGPYVLGEVAGDRLKLAQFNVLELDSPRFCGEHKPYLVASPFLVVREQVGGRIQRALR